MRRCRELVESQVAPATQFPTLILGLLKDSLLLRDRRDHGELKPSNRNASSRPVVGAIDGIGNPNPGDSSQRAFRQTPTQTSRSVVHISIATEDRRNQLASRASHSTSGRQSESVGRKPNLARRLGSGKPDERYRHSCTADTIGCRLSRPFAHFNDTRTTLRQLKGGKQVRRYLRQTRVLYMC